MGKQIVTTLCYAVIVFIFLAVSKFFVGIDGWFGETLDCVVYLSIGFFCGFGQARIK